MQRMHCALVVLTTLFAVPQVAHASSSFVRLLPTPYSCATCHNNAGGGGPRNVFGTTWVSEGRSWAAVYDIDSDGDGFTNGQELGDPDGLWVIGQALPSGPTTRPWDRNDFPTTAGPVCGNGVVEDGEACDDGGTAAGDGCSPTCTVERGWVCDTQSPTVCLRDRDEDGVPDHRDNCPDVFNPGQEDTSGNGVGDACDVGGDDAGSPDAGSFDAGVPDAGSFDAGSPDAGSPNAFDEVNEPNPDTSTGPPGGSDANDGETSSPAPNDAGAVPNEETGPNGGDQDSREADARTSDPETGGSAPTDADANGADASNGTASGTPRGSEGCIAGPAPSHARRTGGWLLLGIALVGIRRRRSAHVRRSA
jgi:cysteine-rich repeat protein